MVIWYGCSNQFFEIYPNHMPDLREKNDLFIYLIEQKVYIFIYCSLFAVCKHNLQINITILVSELNI